MLHTWKVAETGSNPGFTLKTVLPQGSMMSSMKPFFIRITMVIWILIS